MPRTSGSHKYLYRKGTPGNYRYFYKTPDGKHKEMDREEGQKQHGSRLAAGKHHGVHAMGFKEMADEVYGAGHSADQKQRINSRLQNMKAKAKAGKDAHGHHEAEISEAAHPHTQFDTDTYKKAHETIAEKAGVAHDWPYSPEKKEAPSKPEAPKEEKKPVVSMEEAKAAAKKKRGKMRGWKVKVEITGLAGTDVRELDIQATSQSVAERKAWETIGDRTGHVVSSREAGEAAKPKEKFEITEPKKKESPKKPEAKPKSRQEELLGKLKGIGIDLGGAPEEKPEVVKESVKKISDAAKQAKALKKSPSAPGGTASAALAVAEPEFAKSEKDLAESIEIQAKGENPYLNKAKSIFDRIKGDIKPDRVRKVEHFLKALEQVGPTDRVALFAAYKASIGTNVKDLPERDFESATFHTFDEVLNNPPIDLEVERMKRGYAAKQFARSKPYLSAKFTSQYPSAPPPMPVFKDFKSAKEGERTALQKKINPNAKQLVPDEITQNAPKGPDGKPKLPPDWMPIHLMPIWNYIHAKTDNPYATQAPSVSQGDVSTSTTAGYQEGVALNAVRKYIAMRNQRGKYSKEKGDYKTQLVDIPKSKLSEVGLAHKDIFKADLSSDAELKNILRYKIIDPVALVPFIDAELGNKSVKKSIVFVVDDNERFVPRAEKRKSMIEEIRRLRNGREIGSKMSLV